MDIFKTSTHFIITIPRGDEDEIKMEDAEGVTIQRPSKLNPFRVSIDGPVESEEDEELVIKIDAEDKKLAEKKKKELNKRRKYWKKNRDEINARRRIRRLEEKLALEKTEYNKSKNKSK